MTSFSKPGMALWAMLISLAFSILISCEQEDDPQIPPTITALSITQGEVGTSVTITGTNFGTAKADVQVSFNNTASVVTSVNATQIVTAVPSGAASGVVKVRVKSIEVTGPVFTVLEPISVTATPFSATVAENSSAGTALGSVSATTNRGTLSYAISAQSVAGALAINTSTGAITISNAAAFNHEVNATITGTVSVVNGEETATSNLTITVSDVEEVAINNVTYTIAENRPNGTAIGTINCCWIGSSPAFSIVSQTPADAVSINPTNGQLTVNNSALFDFESRTSVTGQFQVVSQSESKTRNFTITITDVNEELQYSATMTIVAGNSEVTGCSAGSTTTFQRPFFGSLDVVDSPDPVLFIADLQCGVKQVTLGTNVSSVSKYTAPQGVAVHDVAPSPNGSFYYATTQFNDGRTLAMNVIRIYNNGTTDVFLSNLTTPTGLTVAPNGDVYVAETDGRKIKRFSSTGTLLTTYGTGAVGSADGNFQSATFARTRDVQRDAAGNLFIADRYSVRKIDTQGNVTTVAGTNASGDAVGAVTAARFNEIHAIGVLPNGNILVADHVNTKIKMITTTGQVVTLITTPGASPEGIIVESDRSFYFTVQGRPVIYRGSISYPGM